MKTHMMSRIVHFICVFVFSSLLVIGLTVFSAGIIGIHKNAYAYANPGTPTGFVNDFAQILSPDLRQVLEQNIKDFEGQTTHEISVVTISTLAGDTIENYANELFADWKIGKEGVDNGVLLLIALEDKKVRIEVGYGLEGALTDAESKYIIDTIIIPAFKNNQYPEGIEAGIESIQQAIVDEFVSGSVTGTSKENGTLDAIFKIIFGALDIFIVLGIVIFQLIIAIMAKSKAWWHGGVLGGFIGIAVLIFAGVSIGIILIILLTLFGLFVDYHVSKSYKRFKAGGARPWFMSMGGGGGGGWSRGSGGGFGGFGGGSSGGGGASGGW